MSLLTRPRRRPGAPVLGVRWVLVRYFGGYRFLGSLEGKDIRRAIIGSAIVGLTVWLLVAVMVPGPVPPGLGWPVFIVWLAGSVWLSVWFTRFQVSGRQLRAQLLSRPGAIASGAEVKYKLSEKAIVAKAATVRPAFTEQAGVARDGALAAIVYRDGVMDALAQLRTHLDGEREHGVQVTVTADEVADGDRAALIAKVEQAAQERKAADDALADLGAMDLVARDQVARFVATKYQRTLIGYQPHEEQP